MRVTKALIQEYLADLKKVHELRRRASSLAKMAEEKAAVLEQFVRDNGGKALSATRCGYVLAIAKIKGSVSWRHEYELIAGVDAAELLVAGAEPGEKLTVEKVG